MAKKVRRRPRQASPARYTAPKSTPPAQAVTTATASPPRARGGASEAVKAVNFAEEYRYVYEDLRRVAILAGTILLILIALSFIIR
jgi:hypothetical protein